MTRILGAPAKDNIDGISASYKVQIMKVTESDKPAEIIVIGYIGEGASLDLNSRYDTPMEGFNLGSLPIISNISNVAQAETGETSQLISNTTKIWNGTDAISFNIPIYFHAYTDAKREVDDAIEALLQMVSPRFSQDGSFGMPPIEVSLQIGEKLIVSQCVIEAVSAELDVPRTADGYMANNTVQLTISRSFTTVSKDISMGEMSGRKITPLSEAKSGAGQVLGKITGGQ